MNNGNEMIKFFVCEFKNTVSNESATGERSTHPALYVNILN